jgi:hypothetical protein
MKRKLDGEGRRGQRKAHNRKVVKQGLSRPTG